MCFAPGEAFQCGCPRLTDAGQFPRQPGATLSGPAASRRARPACAAGFFQSWIARWQLIRRRSVEKNALHGCAARVRLIFLYPELNTCKNLQSRVRAACPAAVRQGVGAKRASVLHKQINTTIHAYMARFYTNSMLLLGFLRDRWRKCEISHTHECAL